ncbi:unnamed protein product [Plutella xylostella]|uniref:(diamondback moth) hypothetical protein n=1 Tax=Plutella xylostella TaxID=51655 RepID=A0A8S4GAT7_PLUXY|nr:unnamed protein product [Plutella xylostella]
MSLGGGTLVAARRALAADSRDVRAPPAMPYADITCHNFLLNHNNRMLDLVVSNMSCSVEGAEGLVPADAHHPPLRARVLAAPAPPALPPAPRTVRRFHAADYNIINTALASSSSPSAVEAVAPTSQTAAPGVVERALAPPAAQPLAGAAWHPAGPRVLAVALNGMNPLRVRGPRARGGALLAGGRGGGGAGGALRLHPAPRDPAAAMRRRAPQYGLQVSGGGGAGGERRGPELWQNAELAEDEALGTLWHFLSLSRSLVEDGCIRSTDNKHPGVLTVVAGEGGGYRSECVPSLFPDLPHRRVTIYRSAERTRALQLCGWGWGWEQAAAGVERAEAGGSRRAPRSSPPRTCACARRSMCWAGPVIPRLGSPRSRLLAVACATTRPQRAYSADSSAQTAARIQRRHQRADSSAHTAQTPARRQQRAYSADSSAQSAARIQRRQQRADSADSSAQSAARIQRRQQRAYSADSSAQSAARIQRRQQRADSADSSAQTAARIQRRQQRADSADSSAQTAARIQRRQQRADSSAQTAQTAARRQQRAYSAVNSAQTAARIQRRQQRADSADSSAQSAARIQRRQQRAYSADSSAQTAARRQRRQPRANSAGRNAHTAQTAWRYCIGTIWLQSSSASLTSVEAGFIEILILKLHSSSLGEERLWRETVSTAAAALQEPYLRALLHFLAATAPAAAAPAPPAAMDAVLVSVPPPPRPPPPRPRRPPLWTPCW